MTGYNGDSYELFAYWGPRQGTSDAHDCARALNDEHALFPWFQVPCHMTAAFVCQVEACLSGWYDWVFDMIMILTELDKR